MIVILMGVSGSGKTTIGKLLSCELNWEFHDGDDFHPQSNVEKMRSGIPLNDDDRQPWLLSIQAFMKRCLEEGRSVVIACSALKDAYRNLLLAGNREVAFVHLQGDKNLIAQRMAERKGHFMNPKLIESQFATLEKPSQAFEVNIANSPAEIVKQIRKHLQLA